MRLRFREMLDPAGLWQQELEYEIKPAHAALVGLLCKEFGLKTADDDVHRPGLAITALALQYYVGRDVVQAVRPGLTAATGTGRHTSRLVDFAQFMVDGERQRRYGPRCCVRQKNLLFPYPGWLHMRLISHKPLWLALVLPLVACSTTAPPAQVRNTRTHGLAGPLHQGSLTDMARWWTQLQDPLLVELIDAAQAVGGIAQAQSRIAQARATQVSSRAALLPALDAQASAGLQRPKAGPRSRTSQAGLRASWEVDLFGANLRQRHGR